MHCIPLSVLGFIQVHQRRMGWVQETCEIAAVQTEGGDTAEVNKISVSGFLVFLWQTVIKCTTQETPGNQTTS